MGPTGADLAQEHRYLEEFRQLLISQLLPPILALYHSIKAILGKTVYFTSLCHVPPPGLGMERYLKYEVTIF